MDRKHSEKVKMLTIGLLLLLALAAFLTIDAG